MATIRIGGKDERTTPDGTEEFIAGIVAGDKNITTKTMLSDRLLSKNVAGGVDVALTLTEALHGQLVFTGVLTANINVTVPDSLPKRWAVYNNTTGGNTLTVKTVSGTGIAITQGEKEFLQSDGTNVEKTFAYMKTDGALGTPDSGTLTNCTGYPSSALAGVPLAAAATGFTATGGTTPKTLTVDDDLSASQSARRNAANDFSDQINSRAMFKDCGYTVVDKGNISNATVTFDYTAGSVQTYTATGSTVTWAFSNWPPTGNLGELLIIGTNMGAYTHTITGLTWTLRDGTTTTSVATFLAQNETRTAFQTSGVDKILLVTRNAGTTVYASLVSL